MFNIEAAIYKKIELQQLFLIILWDEFLLIVDVL